MAKRIHSGSKGKRGERELAATLASIFGCSARRGQQYAGTPDSPDVVCGIPGIHWECKRTEKLLLREAVEQACDDAGEGEVPVVCYRSNRTSWLAIVPLDLLEDLAVRIAWYRGWVREAPKCELEHTGCKGGYDPLEDTLEAVPSIEELKRDKLKRDKVFRRLMRHWEDERDEEAPDAETTSTDT